MYTELLKTRDLWRLCIDRWFGAAEAGVAPLVILAAIHQAVLQTVDLQFLQHYARDFKAQEVAHEPQSIHRTI